MKPFRKYLLALVIALVLTACVIAAYLTQDAISGRVPGKPAATATSTSLIDDRLLQSARQLASVADSADEQTLSHEAERISDHEFDQAFATSLREAAAASTPTTGPLKELTEGIDQTRSRIAADQARIAKLAKQAESAEDASGQLELAKAQLSLDQDELADAQQDLARQGGDRHSKLERALQEHESAQHSGQQQPKPPPPAPVSTAIEQASAWLALSDRAHEVEAARGQAAAKAASLARTHDVLERLVNNKTAATQPASNAASAEDDSDDADVDTPALIARLHSLSDQRKTLAEYDKRIQDCQQLSDIYKRWEQAVESRERSVLHLLFVSGAEVFAILLAVLLINSVVRQAFRQQGDRRRLHQLRVMATIAVQLIGAVAILLVVVGSPSQTSTIIGLATAGLTVVLKDFIVAFLGWFALMGKNGVRIGDWVEIEGVSGEVVEIGLLKTVLLEIGSTASSGHPTGRRVAFVNKFAIENHYFNFSTAGQWLWDELRVALPAGSDPYQFALNIRELVGRETESDSLAAEEDWQRVTHQYGNRTFSAKPAIDLRPSATGLEVVVRYITRAPQRYAMKSKLFQLIVDLIHKPAAAEPALANESQNPIQPPS